MSVYIVVGDYELNHKYIVYFIRDGIGHVKIGITNNINNRLKALQTACALKLQYYAGLQVPNKFKAQEIERYLHEKFNDYRLNGEWFVEQEILKFLASGVVELCGYIFDLNFVS